MQYARLAQCPFGNLPPLRDREQVRRGLRRPGRWGLAHRNHSPIVPLS